MTITMDPRLQQRRRRVAEHGARRRLRAMAWMAMILVVVGLAVWVSQSTLLDVDEVTSSGIENSDALRLLEEAGISPGTPIVSAIWRAGRAERAIEEDPWVSDAAVSAVLPDRVELVVVERHPAAWAEADDGWLLLGGDGVVVEQAAAPRSGLATIRLPGVTGSVGEAVQHAEAAGVLEFANTLVPDVAADLEVGVRDGALWAEAGALSAKLGRAREMTAKATAFMAFLAEDVPEGWAVNLVAPSRPALFEHALGDGAGGGEQTPDQ